MNLIIRELVLKPGYTRDDLLHAAAKRLRCPKKSVTLTRILRRSLDARAIRSAPTFIINAEFALDFNPNLAKIKKCEPALEHTPLAITPATLTHRPVVIGAGPAGLFAALILAQAGVRPILIEQGKKVDERAKDVGAFWGNGKLDPHSNVLCGEGGAGTFSDGKLTSRSKDHLRKDYVLETFVECGAKESILYDAEAHLGSDKLALIIPTLRDKIIALGGEFHFSSCFSDFTTDSAKLTGITVNGENIPTDNCILATGHSARKIYRLLHKKNVNLEAKGFAVGVRVELPQSIVNHARLGQFADNPHLEAASFRLTSQGDCHTFCMCPGGRVIVCADSEGELCTNGMSLSSRAGELANAAFLIPLPPFTDPVSGLDYLAQIEHAAFIAGGSDYSLPATTLADFPNTPADQLPFHSANRFRPADFTKILPEDICNALTTNIKAMLNKLPGASDAVIYGAETRSTAPLKIVRDESMQSVSLTGLYPAGEGAGYAGGIISSAIDGIKAAQAVLGQL